MPSATTPTDNRWTAFVEQHGVVLATASGPVPSIGATIAGGPIAGSWWAHAKSHAIFDALSTLDDVAAIRCFKLVDRKITFVHRRLWPALVVLARAGVLDAARVASIQQQHMPSGQHRNVVTAFPDWVSKETHDAAASLDIAAAREQLGNWVPAARIEAENKPAGRTPKAKARRRRT